MKRRFVITQFRVLDVSVDKIRGGASLGVDYSSPLDTGVCHWSTWVLNFVLYRIRVHCYKLRSPYGQ